MKQNATRYIKIRQDKIKRDTTRYDNVYDKLKRYEKICQDTTKVRKYNKIQQDTLLHSTTTIKFSSKYDVFITQYGKMQHLT